MLSQKKKGGFFGNTKFNNLSFSITFPGIIYFILLDKINKKIIIIITSLKIKCLLGFMDGCSETIRTKFWWFLSKIWGNSLFEEKKNSVKNPKRFKSKVLLWFDKSVWLKSTCPHMVTTVWRTRILFPRNKVPCIIRYLYWDPHDLWALC